MIQRLSHMTLYVPDQDEAKKFYIETVGFELKMDVTMNGFRWLTVAPKGQKELDIVLMAVKPGPILDAETCEQLKDLMRKGKMPTGVLYTADCHATYEELKAKGVEFPQPPAERPYGVEAVMKDPFGNKFSMTQPKEMGK